MKAFLLFVLILVAIPAEAQVGYGNPYGSRYGRQQRTALPQGPQYNPEDEKPKTAAEIVESQMPLIKESVELNPFEEAVVRSILEKSIQKRIELQILGLDEDTTRESLEKIKKEQDEELKQSLSSEKFEAFMALYENGNKGRKAKKKKKKPKS